MTGNKSGHNSADASGPSTGLSINRPVTPNSGVVATDLEYGPLKGFVLSVLETEIISSITKSIQMIRHNAEQAENLVTGKDSNWSPEKRDGIIKDLQSSIKLVNAKLKELASQRILEGGSATARDFYTQEKREEVEKAERLIQALRELLAPPATAEELEEMGKEAQRSLTYRAATVAQLAKAVTAVSWADLIDEETEARKQVTNLSANISLLQAIRSKQGLATENRVEIPADFEKEAPHLYAILSAAAKLAKCELLENRAIPLSIARKNFWGNSELERDQIIVSLTKESGPTKELQELANIAAVFDSLLGIPGEDALTTQGLGALGLSHILFLFMRIYCEQEYATPIAQQKRWWKVTGDQVRTLVLGAFSNQFGETAAAKILNCVDIIYRKFIRSVLLNHQGGGRPKLQRLALALSKKMFTPGSNLFLRLLRTETRTEQKIEMVATKGGKTIPSRVERRYTATIKPTILRGPMTATENAVFAKVNSALAKTETRAMSYDMSSRHFSSPNDWEKKHADWVAILYNRVRIPSSLMTRRRQALRNVIVAKDNAEEDSGKKLPRDPNGQPKITPARWSAEEALYIEAHSASFERQSAEALSRMLGERSLSLAELNDFTEEDILDLLGDLLETSSTEESSSTE